MAVKYCSKLFQEKHWKEHKVLCKAIQHLDTNKKEQEVVHSSHFVTHLNPKQRTTLIRLAGMTSWKCSDAHSKWKENFPMNTLTSSATIQQLSSQTMAPTLQAKSLKISSNSMGSITSELHPVTQHLMEWLREWYKHSGREWRWMEETWKSTSIKISTSLQNHPFNKSVTFSIVSRKETQIKNRPSLHGNWKGSVTKPGFSETGTLLACYGAYHAGRRSSLW